MSKKKANKKTGKKALLGAHLSIAKGYHQAVYDADELGCSAVQIFTKNASTWKERSVSKKEAALFEKAKQETGIDMVMTHTSYLINLASNEDIKQKLSCDALRKEFERSSFLNISYVVHHPGSHMGEGMNQGIEAISSNINRVISLLPDIQTRLLLETCAGQGSNIGHTFEQIAAIMKGVEDKERIGVCLDTCHIFTSGYDIRTKKTYNKTIKHFDSIIGINNLYVIHLNDTTKVLGSKVDRHEHIGRGKIGLKAFEYIMNDKRLADIPKIIETPKGKDGKDWDRINLEKLRRL